MDEVDIVTQTLDRVIQRHMKVIHAYEIEITNMTAEIIRLQKNISKLDKPENNINVDIKEVKK